MHPSLHKTLDQHAGASFDKQIFLRSLIGSLGWSCDLNAGTLKFGRAHEWKIQVLGTESELECEWLWSWANTVSPLSEAVMESAKSIRAFGERAEIPELVHAVIPTNDWDGRAWSNFASGVCQANAYYRGPYEDGAIFLLIKDPEFPAYVDTIEQPLLRLATHFPQMLGSIRITDQKRALEAYAKYLRLSAVAEDDAMVLTDRDGASVTAKFDARGRMTELANAVS